jgi:hypothetical protein
MKDCLIKIRKIIIFQRNLCYHAVHNAIDCHEWKLPGLKLGKLGLQTLFLTAPAGAAV